MKPKFLAISILYPQNPHLLTRLIPPTPGPLRPEIPPPEPCRSPHAVLEEAVEKPEGAPDLRNYKPNSRNKVRDGVLNNTQNFLCYTV